MLRNLTLILLSLPLLGCGSTEPCTQLEKALHPNLCSEDADFSQDDSCVQIERPQVTSDLVLSGCVYAPDGIFVEGDLLVTVEPGTTIKFGENTHFALRRGARLNAVGTEEEPIVFTGEEALPSYWNGVKFGESNSADNQLKYVTIAWGGQSDVIGGSEAAALDLLDWEGPVRISVENTTLLGSAKYGIRIGDNAIIDSFSNNQITENGIAGKVTVNSVENLTNDNDCTGNEQDVFEMIGHQILEEVVWPRIDGTVYHVLESIRIDGEEAFDGKLTIEPGTTVLFEQNTTLEAYRSGSLNAEGTDEFPIVFSGKEPLPGFWMGLTFNSTVSVDNVLDHVVIEYAGGERTSPYSGAPGSIFLWSWSSPVRITLNNTVVRESGGVNLWSDDDATVDGCSNLLGVVCP